MRVARDDGALTPVGEARVWDNGAWRTIFNADPIKALGPVRYYRLQGTLASEYTEHSLALGSTARLLPGHVEFGYSATGTTTHMTPGAYDDFTLSMWAKLSHADGGSVWEWGSSHSSGVYYAWADRDGMTMATYSNGAGGHYHKPYTSISTGMWEHWVFRFRRRSSSQVWAQMWRNGTTTGEVSLGYNPGTKGGSNLVLGSDILGEDTFDGGLSNVAFFGRALTPAEITKIYEVGRT
ncbi:LamG domain-containing protein [Corynebacterium sp. YIM 101645]|uniref:LamG domain-containing protein n=1 Tax=Corynebacterium lemuris TaxID=1859292 RepID=A0ABT2FX80_9CORY|nr:LamG domain-containing protein [Corynebacterium lemuris]MCS5479848.1 LamG domain-containing protein [Corynebacterium lemuris]